MKKQMTYIDSVHRDGRIWNISVMILLLAFPVAVAFVFGTAPDWNALTVGLIATAPMYWAVGAIEAVTFVPMLGAGGSYLSFVTGNITNLKLPCALNALEQNVKKHGLWTSPFISFAIHRLIYDHIFSCLRVFNHM